MAKPNWSRDTVAQLADLVRNHNEAARSDDQKTKLTDLKKIYARGYHGRDVSACAVNGMARVTRHLDQLAKSNFDGSKHPRGSKGEFTSDGGKTGGAAAFEALPLPKTARQHAKLQASNAAYRALTSDVVPERRNEVIGQWARLGLSGALGTGLVLSLARHGGSGLAARLLESGGRKVGQVAAGVPTAAVTYTATMAGHKLAGRAARLAGKTLRGDQYGFARGSTKAATAAGGYAGAKLGQGATAAMRLLVDSAQRAGADVLHPKAARAGVLAGLSGGAGLLINNQIEDTPVDPERIGAGYDAFSYRTIEKMAGGAAALDAAADGMLAKLGDASVGDVLTKAGFYNQVGQRVLPAAAALLGGTAAAGVAEAGHAIAGTREYERDAHGRFASKANAVTLGAAIGGALATGAGVFLALRRHNVGQLVRHVDSVADAIGTRLEAATSDEGTGHVAELIKEGRADAQRRVANREIEINSAMLADPDHAEAIKKLDSYAGSSDAHLKSKVRAEVNAKLAEVLSQHNDFRIPGTDKDPAKWATIGDVRRNAGTYKAGTEAHSAVLGAVDSASDEEFRHAIAKLTPGQQETALHWMRLRGEAIDAVPGDVAAHTAKIDKALKAVDAAAEVREAKRVAMLDAKAVVDRTTGETEKAAAEAAFTQATTEHEAAGAAYEKAQKAVGKLRDTPSGVKSPVTGKPLPPATEAEINVLRTEARRKAYSRASAKVDAAHLKAAKAHGAKVAEARSKQVAQITLEGDRMLAARAALGHSLGVLPDKAAAAGIQAAALRRFIQRARGELVAAHADVAAAEKRVADLKIAKRGKTPEGMTAEDTAKMVGDERAVHDALIQAKLRANQAQAKLSARQYLLRKHSSRFLTAIRAEPIVEGTRGKMPVSVYRQMLRDVSRATEDLHKPVNQFLHSPSAQALKRFATSTGEYAYGVSTTAAHAFRDVFRATFMRKTGDGADDWGFDPAKILVRGGLGVVAGDVAHDLYQYGKGQASAALGMGDGKAPKFPRSIKVEKHVDPYTGAGFVGLSVADPDPDNKGDRVLLWGEHYKDHTGRAETLHPGSRVSGLRNRFNNGQQGGGGGGTPFMANDRDIPGLSDQDKQVVRQSLGKLKERMNTIRVEDGHEFKLRPNSDTAEDQAAGMVANHIKKQFLGNGSPSTGKLYHEALAATLGSTQGRVLKQKQVYELLTGFSSKGGAHTGKSIFPTGQDSDFGEADNKPAILDALRDEMTRAVEAHPPSDEAQRANMKRAAAVIGRQKGLGDEDLKGIYKVIGGGAAPVSIVKPAETQAPAAPRVIDALPVKSPSRLSPESEVSRDVPAGWDQAQLREAALKHAADVGRLLNVTTERKQGDIAAALEHFAKQVHRSHDLPMRESLFAARNAVKNAAGTTQGDRTVTRDALADVDTSHFANHLSAAADEEHERYEKRQRAEKLYALDDIDALMKGVIGDALDSWSSEPRVPSGAGGGEFSAGGARGSFAANLAQRAGNRLARDGVDETVDRVGRSATKATPQPGSNYTPTKIASDIGGLATGEAAAYGASKLLGRFFPEESGAVNLISAVSNAFKTDGASAAAGVALKHVAGAPLRAAKAIPKLAATSGAGLTGFAAGSAAGAGAVRGAYALAGRKAPTAAPPKQSVGEGVAESLGNIGGAIIGGALAGGPMDPLSIATGAAGGYAGGIIGRNVYDAGAALGHLFGAYGAQHQTRMANTLRAATTPRPAPVQS